MKDLDHLKLPRAGETSSRFTKEQALAAQKFPLLVWLNSLP